MWVCVTTVLVALAETADAVEPAATTWTSTRSVSRLIQTCWTAWGLALPAASCFDLRRRLRQLR